MRFFDALCQGPFKKDQNGNTVFFPYGVFGRGLVLRDSGNEQELRRFLKRWYKAAFLTLIPLAALGHVLWSMAAAISFVAWFRYRMKALLAGCLFSEDRLSLKESMANSAAGYSRWNLWLLLGLSIFFVSGGVLLAFTAKTPSQMQAALGLVVVFGMGAGIFGYTLLLKSTAHAQRAKPSISPGRPSA